MGVGQKNFRPEIHGLRAVAALLVAIYHLWFDRISGGVDVFFVVSGFLITESLVRQAEATGRIDVLAYLVRLSKRLFPAAMLVLLFVIVGSLLWLPEVRWAETVPEIFAAALYYENWQLAFTATDYLAQDAAASPVQHYWALSIQGQFYVLWPVLVLLVAVLAHRFGAGVRQGMPVALAAIFSASLMFSIFATRDDQAFAYFNTFARIWEFALGGLLALALPFLNPARWLRLIAGWLGLLAIVTCGMVIPGDQFPGYAALWPTLGAVMVIVAGTGHVRHGAELLLASRPMQWFGDIAYSLYLWHWPVMILFMAGTGRDAIRSGQAIFILLLSILLAWLTTRLIENPLRFSQIGKRHRWHGPAFAAICLLPVLLLVGGWQVHLDKERRMLKRFMVDNPDYPGAAVILTGREVAPPGELPVIPPPAQARADVPEVYEQGCHQMPRNPEVLSCEFGSDDPELTVAVVGGSHAAHWLPAFRRLAEEHDWRIVSMTKSACRFNALFTRGHESCHDWNLALPDHLAELAPDVVFTTGTVGDGSKEHVPEGFILQWRALGERGIPVLALRDTPRIGFNVPECVERIGGHATDCGWRRSHLRGLDNPIEQMESLPVNVEVIDVLDYLCNGDHCPAVIGNVLVYRDGHHLTTTFARTMAPVLFEPILRAAKRAEAKTQDLGLGGHANGNGL